MRRYYLASVEKRGNVDLREYEEEITEAVHQIMPYAQVVVEKDCYTVHPTPARGDAIRIGRLLSSRDVMGKYCIRIPKLFCSEEVEKGKVNVNGTEKKCVGGHQ
jgi:hypothetical protein